MELQKRPLGKTGVDVTIVGLGGEGILRTFGYEEGAYELINHAIDLGINYFESARAYSGSESYYGLALKERRKDIFLASKSHERTKRGALLHLTETLKNMETDHLDLWQVHDVRTDDDVEAIFASGGAIEAFSYAKETGKVRFIGVTGHHDPDIIAKCLELFDFDTVLIPVNPAEHVHKSFIDKVIPLALSKNMGIIAMKVYIRGFLARLPWYNSMEPFLRFALTYPVSTAVVGCDDTEQLKQNVQFATAFTPMGHTELKTLIELLTPYARKLMYYKPLK
ncbi:MAG: aldo/keto reductase [Candidatus Magnetoovum sp. WYHC-5]|nr:aldo/keto reductase [Candidatus Magnetoovum sp. WYHC-5]